MSSQAYAAKKSKKPALIAKTSVLLDVKPWDDETPMDKLKECVKTIQMDGLVWGADKFVPVGYGINKLQVSCENDSHCVQLDKESSHVVRTLLHRTQRFANFNHSVTHGYNFSGAFSPDD